ncbi:MAG TPA: monovalent cation:proton antiporter-2 (CPA2) family protein [Steroidobacteraceae bacterium]|nr:monovalent cation:proton antiporter-2 (CPA2) family protein [Steroidobacteraceae bacterium]
MIEQPLTQVLIMLAAAVLVVALARRAGWPPMLGYLIVGMVLGPHAFGLVSRTDTTSDLAQLGVAFLLFTLGLEFSLPRMMAVRREVFGLGALQVAGTLAVFALAAHGFGVPWLRAALLGGALSMSSTAIVLHTLTDRGELNRTHGRLAFSVLLFQDLAFVPLLALAAALSGGRAAFSARAAAWAVGGGVLAVAAVLAAGRWLLRPLFHEIAHSRLKELFTLAVLLVVLASAWTSSVAGLSLALGAFLAGLMLAETEYRHQIDSAIRPFRDVLLGLFFISVGMLLDLRLVVSQFAAVSALLAGLLVLKAAVAALATRLFVPSTFKAVRTGVVICIGGEFGIALLTLVLQNGAVASRLAQPLLLAVVLSMVASPLILANNARIARAVLRERRPRPAPPDDELLAGGLARREHVILAGFGRVGQSVARVLEAQGIEYLALDLDPARIRTARQAGEPVLYGDPADEDMLVRAGIGHANAVVVSFASLQVALGVVRTARRLRAGVPLVTRSADEPGAAELRAAGADEVVLQDLETGLLLGARALQRLQMSQTGIQRALGAVRQARQGPPAAVHPDAPAAASPREEQPPREEQKSVVIPPGAWAVGRSVEEIRRHGAAVAFTGIRRHGILGREPEGATRVREGDIVVIHGTPAALEHAEGVLLAG